ncbi:unnamed protein product [Cuscuta epithymum]|uniref:Amino acid transporter transmembrane domain-containing protein n=1 Tax=Cuscuta epithymum TaxID=186058 RepID=A0AAV0DIB0_9ASTE|nr:unnamed protein product [Cuscuta epithymum]
MSIIGAGIMSIPASVKVLGVIPAFILTVAVAVLVDISADFLLRFTYAGNATTYAGLMKESFGQFGSLALQICIMIANLGLLNHVPNYHWGCAMWERGRTLGDFARVVWHPLVDFPRILHLFESLWWSSALAVLLSVVFVGICIVMAIYALFCGHTETPRLLPQLDSSASFFNLFTAVPVIVTAFTFHFNVHPIGIELGKASTMASAVKISLVLCSLIYFSIGIFGYLLFGESTNADILVNFAQTSSSSGSPVTSVLNDIVRLTYALHLVLVFPLVNYPMRANIDELFFPKKILLVNDSTRFVSLSVFLLALTYVAAIAIPSIWYIFQFLGSTTTVCLAFIFPGAIALRDIHGISSRKDKIVAIMMILQALVTSCITISTNVYNMLT